MFRFAKLTAAAVIATGLLAGTASAQTVLRSSDTHPDGYPTVEAVKYFGQLVEERTAGRYKVEVYFGAQLGQEADTIEQVRSGVIDLNRVSMAPWNSLVPLTLDPLAALPVPLARACPQRDVGPDRRRDRRRL